MGETRHGSNLLDFAMLSGWPTPNAGPQNDGDTTWEQRRAELKAKHNNGNGFGMTLGQASQLAGWATPTTRDHKDGAAPSVVGSGRTDKLAHAVQLAGWSTPTCPLAHDSDHSAFRWNPNKRQDDPVMQILGRDLSLSHVPMEKRAQLNPAFSLWLMGYPAAWASSGALAMQSCRLLRRRSSKRTATPEGSDAA